MASCQESNNYGGVLITGYDGFLITPGLRVNNGVSEKPDNKLRRFPANSKLAWLGYKWKNMSIKLDFDLIYEIVSHGAKFHHNETVDPSTSSILEDAGVAMVTTYIEQLSLLNLVGDPFPIFGKKGGMWIGYRLTEKGKNLSNSKQELRKAVADLTGDAKQEVSQSVYELYDECQQIHINENYRTDFLCTLKEIAVCFDNDCYMATIGLCGKVLEVCLKEILIRHKIEFRPRIMIGELIGTIQKQVPSEYIDPTLMDVTNIVNTSRITAVHARESIPVASRDQTIMVIFAMRNIVRKNLIRCYGQ
jgi:hypothetical protein